MKHTPPLTRLLHDRRLWIAVGFLGVVLALRAAGVGELLSLDTLARHREALLGFVAAELPLAAAAYIAVYALAVALSLPGAVVLTLAGGFLFGAGLGTALTVVAATLGAVAVFLLARRIFGGDALERLGAPARRLAAGLRRDAAVYLLVLRLVPLFPFWLVNLVPAFAGVRLPVFAATTLAGILPGTAVFSLAGAGLGDILAAGGELSVGSILTPRILAGLLGLAALSLLGIPLRRWLERRG
jgi:uncharacterized membrane protein YdjX (TVP38/TMEM64 family)